MSLFCNTLHTLQYSSLNRELVAVNHENDTYFGNRLAVGYADCKCLDIFFVPSLTCCSLRHLDYIHLKEGYLSVNFRVNIVYELNYNCGAFCKIQQFEHH